MTIQIATNVAQDWEILTSGDGAVNIGSDGKIVCTAPESSSDQAYIFRRIKAEPGETITLRALVKSTSPNVTDKIRVSIGYPIVGGNQTFTEPLTENWEVIECTWSVPYESIVPNYLQLAIGKFSFTDGVGEILFPQILVDRPSVSVPRVHGMGQIRIFTDGMGDVVVDPVTTYFPTIGIKDIALDQSGGISKLTFTLPTQQSTRVFPIIQAHLGYAGQDRTGSGAEGGAASIKLDCKVHSYDPATGQVEIRFINLEAPTAWFLIPISTTFHVNIQAFI